MTATERPKRDGQDVASAYERIRAAILSGELAAGASVPQGALSTQFDIGRTPLREALRLLQRDGLVIAEPNHPVRVATLSAEDVDQLYVMRISLETVAIRITVPRMTSDDFAELEACMAKMDHYQQAGDQVGLRAPHRALHHRLIAGSGPKVSAEIARLADHAERYRLRFGGSGDWEDRRAEHRALVDAAKNGDPELAAQHLAIHYAHTAILVFSELDSSHDLRTLRTTLRAVAPGAEAALNSPGFAGEARKFRA